MRTLIMLTLAASLIAGCRSHDQRTVFVSTTQPSIDNGSPRSSSSRRVDVVMHDREPSRHTSIIGRKCRLQFRRDALGMATPAPLSLEIDNSAGRPVALYGRITDFSDACVVLESNNKTYWIPLSSVLLIELRE